MIRNHIDPDDLERAADGDLAALEQVVSWVVYGLELRLPGTTDRERHRHLSRGRDLAEEALFRIREARS